MAGTTARVSPVSNVQYDIIAMGHNLLEGITALAQYQQDAIDDGNLEAQALFENVRSKFLEAWAYIEAYDNETCGRPGARGPHARGPHLSGCP